MPANIEDREKLEKKGIKSATHLDYSFVGLSDESESEIKWVKLHQMFDR
tara:strand:+ start:3553 stop:3699 length:147 start_codon:yes stop_codon:yes gene_type:complete